MNSIVKLCTSIIDFEFSFHQNPFSTLNSIIFSFLLLHAMAHLADTPSRDQLFPCYRLQVLRNSRPLLIAPLRHLRAPERNEALC